MVTRGYDTVINGRDNSIIVFACLFGIDLLMIDCLLYTLFFIRTSNFRPRPSLKMLFLFWKLKKQSDPAVNSLRAKTIFRR